MNAHVVSWPIRTKNIELAVTYRHYLNNRLRYLHLMLWSRLESLDHVYYLILFLSSCNAVLWIRVGTRFVGFLAHNHNEIKWILNSFSTDLYPPAFSRDIYETFLVFE